MILNQQFIHFISKENLAPCDTIFSLTIIIFMCLLSLCFIKIQAPGGQVPSYLFTSIPSILIHYVVRVTKIEYSYMNKLASLFTKQKTI